MTASLLHRSARRTSAGRKIASAVVWIVVVFNLAVFAWIFINSLRTHSSIFANPWGLPSELHVENWVEAWTTSGFGAAILNSVLVCVTAAVGVVLISDPAGHILATVLRRITDRS